MTITKVYNSLLAKIGEEECTEPWLKPYTITWMNVQQCTTYLLIQDLTNALVNGCAQIPTVIQGIC